MALMFTINIAQIVINFQEFDDEILKSRTRSMFSAMGAVQIIDAF